MTVRSVNPASLDSWSRTVIQRATIKPRSGGGSVPGEVLHFLGDLGGSALHATVGLGETLYKIYEQFHSSPIPGATSGLIPPETKALFNDTWQGLTHPGRLVTAVFNWQLLEKDPAKWLGALVPTIAIAAVTDGTGALAARATDTAADVAAPGVADTEAGAARLAEAIKEVEDPSVKLDWAKLAQAVGAGDLGAAEVKEAVLLYRSKQLLDSANNVISAGGHISTLEGLGSGQNDEPGIIPDKGADHVGKAIGGLATR